MKQEAQAVFSLPEQQLGAITVQDFAGSTYAFPDVNVTALKNMLPPSGRRPENLPCLMIVNVSVAVLSIPFKNIQSICVGTEVLWNATA